MPMLNINNIIVENLTLILSLVSILMVFGLFGGRKVIDQYKTYGKMPNDEVSSLDLESPTEDDYKSIITLY